MPRGQLPKAYLRMDPDLNAKHPDNLSEFVRLMCAANRRPWRVGSARWLWLRLSWANEPRNSRLTGVTSYPPPSTGVVTVHPEKRRAASSTWTGWGHMAGRRPLRCRADAQLPGPQA